jgi:Flp pilus assembly protein TadD
VRQIFEPDTAMKNVSAWNATSVLCALWLGACASSAPTTGKAAAAAPAAAQTASPAPGADADVATIAKNLPGTLDGEIRRAQLLRSKGDFDDASHALAQLMLVAPDDARVIGEYGKVLAQQGQSLTALPFLRRAVELEPKDWTLYSALGVAYDQTDDHNHARVAYEHALELAPGDPTILNNYAVSRMLAGDLNGAQRLLAQASAKGASDPKITNNTQMLASLRGSAASAPKKVAAATTPSKPMEKTASREAAAPPKPILPSVMMQAVPADPLAGPVKPKTPPRSRLASTAKPGQPAHVSPPPSPPALRTAAEAN